jgi:hypothetical protein
MLADRTESDGRHLDAPPAKPCGDCGMCCKILRINVLDKPAGLWCRHFRKGAGCSIHESSPVECQRFQCYWSISEALGDEWRPDRSKLLIWSNVEGRIIVDVDPAFPGAWRLQPFYGQLKAWSDRDRPLPLEVLVRVKDRMWVIFPEAEVDLGPPQLDQSITSGYRVENGRNVPFAMYVAPADAPAARA